MSQRYGVQDLDTVFFQQLQDLGLELFPSQGLRLVGIAAKDHGHVLFGGKLQELGIGVVPFFEVAQLVEFQVDSAVPGLPDQGEHPLAVDIWASCKVQNVRVGNIGVHPGLHGGDALAAVALQKCRVIGLPDAVGTHGLVAHKVLP